MSCNDDNVLVEVREKSTQDFDVKVKDDTGTLVTPTAMTYTLTERDGTVINDGTQDLEDISVTPALTTRITLAGNALKIIDSTKDREYRILTVKTDRGDALKPENIQIEFWVINLIAVS